VLVGIGAGGEVGDVGCWVELGVAFVHCRVSSRPNLKENHEFTAIGFFDKTEMKALELYYNVKTLINRTR